MYREGDNMGVMKRLLEYKMYKTKPSLRDFDLDEWIFKKEVGSRIKEKTTVQYKYLDKRKKV